MAKKNKIQVDTLFDSIKEEDIQFPIYYANKSRTIYTCLKDEEKFEQLTLSQGNESFRGSILFGYNELHLSFIKDKKIAYHSIIRVHDLITEKEYEDIFNSIIQGREEFFNESKYEYIDKIHPLTQDQLNKYIKHKWRKPQ